MNTEKNRHILLFTTAYLPLIGGAEIAIKEIIDRLSSSWRVTVITARLRKDLPAKEQIGRTTVHRIGIGHWSDKIRLALFGARYARRRISRPHIVWAMMASYAGFAGLFYKKSRPKIPFLLTLQEGDSLSHIYRRVWFVWPWFREIFRRADCIQAISTFLADWAKRMGTTCSVEVVPNGVDVKRVEMRDLPHQRRENIRKEYNISREAPVILTISRLTKKNGIEDLIRAMSHLPQETHLLIVGSGSLGDRLQEVAQELNLLERVHFAGAVPHAELPPFFVAANVFCRPSISEGLGIVFLEAFAAGIPVVATPVGGIPDIVKDEETGLLAQPKNPHDIAEKIQRLLSDATLRNSIIARAFAFVQSGYSWDSVAERLSTIFVQLCSRIKILIAADIFPPESGGPATYAVTLANECVKQGIGVKIVSLTPESDRAAVSCPLFFVSHKNKLLRYLEYFFLLLKHSQGADIIYAMGPVNAGLPALIVARLRRKKFVVKMVGDYAWEQYQNSEREIADFVSVDRFQEMRMPKKIAWLKDRERQVCRQADRVIVPSEYLKHVVIGWGVSENRVKVVYNAVQFQAVDPFPKSFEERWIVSVGRLVPWKGMDALIGCMPEILKEVPEARLKIVGDGPERESLASKVKSQKLDGSVELLGNLPREKTLAYIHAADVFVLNSGYEGLSHVILEALSFGRPILASNVGGNPEVVIPGQIGELFSYNHTEEIIEKILVALKKKAPIHPLLSPFERIPFFERFRLETMIQETENMLKELCRS